MSILNLVFLKRLFIACAFSIVLNSAIEACTMSSSSPDVLEVNTSTITIPTVPVSLSELVPGLYKSDDMEQILSFPLSSFGEEDIVIFDMDQTLITQLRPYYQAHQEKNSPLHERLMLQSDYIKGKFDAYMCSFSPYALMDERIPDLIKELQRQKVKCIANTAACPIFFSAESVDVPSLRVRSLQAFSIDFSGTFPYRPFWDFSTLEAACIIKYPPVFKDGIILSADVPKHITTLELLKNLPFTPRRVVFIDDTAEHVQKMYEALTAEGIESYCFMYSKAHNTSPLDYFMPDLATIHLTETEAFLEKLLSEEDVDEIFRVFYK